MIIEIVVGVVVVVIVFSLMIGYFYQRVQYMNMTKHFIKASLERHVLQKELAEVIKDNDALKFSENQDFVKFLSDSREMAFSYIEDVQGRLRNLNEAIKKNDSFLMEAAINSLLEMLPKEEVPNN